VRFRTPKQYKYKTFGEFTCYINAPREITVYTDFVEMGAGEITIADEYAWDGSTGVSDKHSIIASLVHDALYQLMRLGLVDLKYRIVADRIYRDMCIAEGMSRIEAGIRYQGLRWFGEKYAKPREVKPINIYEVKLSDEE